MPKVPTKPKTVADKIKAAIIALNQPNGSSRQSIAKYLKENFNQDNPSALRKALKNGVTKGDLVQEKQSFKVKGFEPDPADVDPSERLEIIDEKNGSGDEAESGSTVTMSYRGTLEDGTAFDSAKKFKFMIDAGEVIKGWDRGIKGMKVGGSRKLVIGSKLGYGKRGSPPEIPGNATLMFAVKLLKVE